MSLFRIMRLLSLLIPGLAGTSHAGDGERVHYAAPAVAGVNQDGVRTDFAELYRKGPLVVFFYPKAGTPGCTAQACSLRDAFAELTQKGVRVLGVSTDTQEAQKKFKESRRLPYDLIADPKGEILAAFKVPKVMGGLLPYAARQCFLIKDGMVVWHDASASTSQQAADILKVLDSAAGSGQRP